MWRQLGKAVTAVPSAVRAVASRRFVRGVLALPVAAAGTAGVGLLAWMVLINVGYPLRQVLGLGGHDGSVWASTYDAWGGPTLAGAWAVHAAGVMLFVFPPLAWAIRGLLRAQGHLLDSAPEPAPAPAAAVAGAPARPRWRRAGVIAAALAAVYVLALVSHAAGIGDNVVWLPRDLRSGLALAVVLAPVVVAAATARKWWHQGPGTAGRHGTGALVS